MKAERRHELQANALAKTIDRAPQLLEQYGGKIAFFAVAALVLVGLLYFRSSTLRAGEQMAAQGLVNARSLINDLRNQAQQSADPQTRDEVATQAVQALDAAASSDDPAMVANALVTKGDLYWLLATTAPAEAPSTQPASGFAPQPQDHLKSAEQVYTTVLEKYSGQPLPAASARFGLAAIAENRGEWDAAKRQYDAVLADAKTPQVLKDYAEKRLQTLPELQQPIFMAEAKPAEAPVQVIKVTPGEGAVQLDPTSEEFKAAAAGAAAADDAAPTTAPSQP